jgi:hypothetical protein
MLANTSHAEFSPAQTALANKWAVKALARLPYRPLHRLLTTTSRLEAWLRWPLRTLNASDHIDETLALIDSKGERFGLTQKSARRFKDGILYDNLPDLLVLLTGLRRKAFICSAFKVENQHVLDAEKEAGSGAIVVGFRLGPHATLPYVLGTLGHDVSMVVGSASLARTAARLGREFVPEASRRLRFLAAGDPLVLARTVEELNGGRLVCTLMELGAGSFQKTTPVRFLDWTLAVPYGLPYLAAMTGRRIIPAVITREAGPGFRLSFLEPIPQPSRDRASIFAATQALYTELEVQVRRFPDQWVGWTLLESHMGVKLRES